MKFLLRITYIALIILCFISCSGNKTDKTKPIVTVSLAPQKYLLEQIVGDRIDIKCLLENGGNPESYEPSFANMSDLEASVLYFRAGNMTFEDRLLQRISQVNPALKIIDTSTGIDLIEGTHLHTAATPHRHAAPAASSDVDPHTWSSVKNARVIVKNMLDAIVQVDSVNADFYRANYNRFDSHLDSMDKAITRTLEPLKSTHFLVWHPSLSYFARDYGLHQIAVGHSTKESSIPNLQHSIDSSRDRQATVFFFQKEMDSRQAEAVNEQIGAKRVDINPLDYDWEADINRIVDAIVGSSTYNHPEK